MPVESDSGGKDADDLEEESGDQGVDETLGLLCSSDSTVGSAMQSTNSECSGGRGREDQPLLDNEISTERDDEEYTEETSSDCESGQFSGVPRGRIGEKAKRVHGRDSGNEEDTKTTSGC